MLVTDEMIGGGVVLRGFTKGSEFQRPGTEFTREELLAIPRQNLQALVDTKKLQLTPPTRAMLGQLGELHIINRGFGKFDVLEGRLLNEQPMDKADAEAMVADLQAKAAAMAEDEPGEDDGGEPPAPVEEPPKPN